MLHFSRNDCFSDMNVRAMMTTLLMRTTTIQTTTVGTRKGTTTSCCSSLKRGGVSLSSFSLDSFAVESSTGNRCRGGGGRRKRRTEEETSSIERETDRILSRNLPRRDRVFQRPRERRYPQSEGSFGKICCRGKGGGGGLDAKPLERTMEINLHDRVRRDRITRFFGTTTTVAVFSTAANRGWRHLSRV